MSHGSLGRKAVAPEGTEGGREADVRVAHKISDVGLLGAEREREASGPRFIMEL